MLARHARMLLEQARPRLAWSAADRADHMAWRARIREQVGELAGISAISPLRVTATRELVAEDLMIREYDFVTADERVVQGQLIVRRFDDTPGPLVFFCQGRNVPRDYRPKPSANELPTYGSHEFARWGFPTFMLDYGLFGGFEAEKIGNRDETNVLALALGLLGRSPLGYVVANALAALAWLHEQPWVDRERVAIFGRSLGGQVALHTALLAPQPHVVALSSSIGSYASMFGRDTQGGGAHALPGMLLHCDMPDLIAGLCPLALYIQVGEDDAMMPIADAERALATIRAAYDTCTAGDRLTIDRITGKGHATHIPSVARHLAQTIGPRAE